VLKNNFRGDLTSATTTTAATVGMKMAKRAIIYNFLK
jgi:hypothetical protein